VKIESLNAFLNNSEIHTFIPFVFPSNLEACSTINISGGTVKRGGVQKVFLRVLTRETHPSISVNKANEIKEYLSSNLKGAFFDGTEVLNVEANSPEPLYIGEEDGLYLVSYNYTIIEG
jgi:hypothetical protein